jgi:hypothetical protein
VALAGTDVSEDFIASVITVNRISELGKPLAITSNWKREFLQDQHFVTSQKTAFFRVTAERNLKPYIH